MKPTIQLFKADSFSADEAGTLTLAGCDHFNAIPHGLLKAAVFDFLDGYLDGM